MTSQTTNSVHVPPTRKERIMEHLNTYFLPIAVAGLVITTLLVVGIGHYSLSTATAAVIGTLSPLVVVRKGGLGRWSACCFLLVMYGLYIATLVVLLNGYATTLEMTIFNGAISLLIIPELLA